MPMTINVGFNRKVGEANFSSRGASVNVEVEADSALVREPDRLQEKIDYLFRLAKSSVDSQLNGNGRAESEASHSTNDQARNTGHNNNGNGQRQQRNGRAATASQIRAIHAIAGRQKIDLPSLLRERFGTGYPRDLSISEASQMIDELKASADEAGGRQ